MITKDMRFNYDCIKSFIGKPFIKYRCDEFVYTSSVTQIVGIYIGNDVYKITNIQEPLDYFGNEEDVAVFKLQMSENSEITSAFIEGVQTDTPIGGIIDAIVIVNENQQIFEHGEQTYDVWLTRGIIFKVGGREISFEKQAFPFSEEINVQRGYDLIDRFESTDAFSKDWPTGITAVAKQEVITFE